ncbi:MAG: hypothetical protein WCV50_02010 [Patescibacteria group bacterium]|jgi:hypothetical protein
MQTEQPDFVEVNVFAIGGAEYVIREGQESSLELPEDEAGVVILKDAETNQRWMLLLISEKQAEDICNLLHGELPKARLPEKLIEQLGAPNGSVVTAIRLRNHPEFLITEMVLSVPNETEAIVMTLSSPYIALQIYYSARFYGQPIPLLAEVGLLETTERVEVEFYDDTPTDQVPGRSVRLGAISSDYFGEYKNLN